MASIKLKHSGGNGVIIAAPTSNPASDKTLTLPSDVDGTVVSKDSSNSLQNIAGINGGQLGNRNLWINGACLVNQRGSSSTSEGYQTIDRFYVGSGGTDEAQTQAQVDVASGTTPYTLGFRKALRITNGNQTSGAGSGDFMYLKYTFEAQDIANSGWNYLSSSSFITFSFYVKSSVAQSFKAYFHTRQGTEYQYPFETGSLSADTWTKVTKTISGNSNLTFNSDNGLGLELYIWSFIGTDYTASSVTEDAWSTYNSSARMKDATSTWYTTNDATLEFTGFQFEVGSTETDFEHKSFAEELRLCQRYFQQISMSTMLVGASNGSSQIGNVTVPVAVPMRATPTIASGITYHAWHGDNNGQNNDGTALVVANFSTTNPAESTVMQGTLNGFSGLTDNRIGGVTANSGTPIKLDAEL